MKVNEENRKLTLLAEKLWVIRSMTDVRVSFYMARRVWSGSPMQATIFQDRNAAEHVLYDLMHAENAIRLPDEEYEIVPLYDAVLTYGQRIHIQRPKA